MTISKQLLTLSACLALAACSAGPQSPTASTPNTAVSASQSLQSIDIEQVPAYAIKPAANQVSLTGQLKIPANLILNTEELSQITAPPQGITAPPQGITAPPQGITAPPLGVLPAQAIFGIRSIKTPAISTSSWAQFFQDNFQLNIPEISQSPAINHTVIQFINGQPYFVASYVVPQLQPGQNYSLEASHPLLNLSTSLKTGAAGNTLASDLDLGSTAVDLVKKKAATQNRQVNLAHINARLSELENTVGASLQQRFQGEASEAQLDAAVTQFVNELPAFSAPERIQIAQPKTLQLKVGEQMYLDASTHYADDSQTQGALWQSSNGISASVMADGLVKALSPGRVTISAAAFDNPELQNEIILNIVQ